MALVDMSCHLDDLPISLNVIALRQDLSVSYLEQLFLKLRRNGLVESVRGQGGGYVLTEPPAAISIGRIVRAVEEKIEVTRCVPTSRHSCQGKTTRCLTHQLWEGLGNQIGAYLEGISLQDVVDGRAKNMVKILPVLNDGAAEVPMQPSSPIEMKTIGVGV